MQHSTIVHFVNTKEFEKALQSNTSQAYFEHLGTSDLIARSAASRQQYHSTYVQSFAPMHAALSSKLAKLAIQADTMTRGHDNAVIAALPALPWKFALVDNVEGGMPHTHADVICLPPYIDSLTLRDALRTLIHEKVHVLQRARPDLTKAFVSNNGYYRVCRRNELDRGILSRARSNPDLDQHIYGKNGRISIFLLKKQPVSLADGRIIALFDNETFAGDRGKDEYEHPFEMMAHALSELLVPI